MSHPFGSRTILWWPSGRQELSAAARLAAMGVSGSFSQPLPWSSRDKYWFESCYTVLESSAGRRCLESPRKPNGSEEKGRWRATMAERVPGCSWALLVGNHRYWQNGHWCRNVGRVTCVSVPETPSVLDKHLPGKLSSGRGHIYLQFSQEQTYSLRPGPLAYWQPSSPAWCSEGGEQVLECSPSFLLPPSPSQGEF